MQSIQVDSLEVGEALQQLGAEPLSIGARGVLERCIVMNNSIWEVASDYQKGVAQIIPRETRPA